MANQNALRNGSNSNNGALDGSMGLPPLPHQDREQSANALNSQPGPTAQPQQMMPPQAPPAPTHAQTVAALRHFGAIIDELGGILKNPDLGKASVKSSVIDGTTRLVADRMMSPAQAVEALSNVPERPYDQKVWAITQLDQALKARATVLAQHSQAFAGAGPEPTPSSDTHMNDIASMMSAHYSRNPVS